MAEFSELELPSYLRGEDGGTAITEIGDRIMDLQTKASFIRDVASTA
jgi:hypothetical protein